MNASTFKTLSVRTLQSLVAVAMLAAIGGCAGMTTHDKNVTGGAAIGAVAGAVLTGGSPIGTVGGAAVGGVIGNTIDGARR